MLANSAGRPAQADRLLRRALRALDGPDSDMVRYLRGRARVTLALALFNRGRVAEALDLLREVEEGEHGARGHTVLALGRIQQSGILTRIGQWPRALEVLSTVDADRDELSDRAGCVVELNLGITHQYLHHLAESERHLVRAERMAAVGGFADLRFMAQHNLGRLAFVRGDLAQALDRMARANALPADVNRSTSRCEYARVLIDAGLLDEAESLLHEARAEARSSHLVQEDGEASLELTRLGLLTGDYPEARREAAASRRAFARRDATAWRAQAELLELEAALVSGAPSRRMVERATALADGPAHEAGVASQAAMLAAEALARAGRLDEARERLTGIGGPRRLSFTERLHLALTRATVAAAAGERPRSRAVLRRAAGCLADEQARYAGLDNRTALALHSRRLTALDIALALQSGTPSAVFAATERWRGVSSRLPPVTPSGDARLDGLLARLRQLRGELRSATGTRRQEIIERVRRLERDVAHRDWETASTGAAHPHHERVRPVGYPELRAALAAERVGLVALFVHDGRLRAVTVQADRAVVTDLADQAEIVELVQRGAADLTTIGRVGVTALREAVDRSLTSTMGRLDVLLRPAYPDSAERLVILPSRLLASLPWRLLPGIEGRPLVVAPSATFWTGGPGYAARPPAEGMLAIAGPDLGRARVEAAAVARRWAGTAVAGTEATGDVLTSALRDRRVVHVAAHGTHHDQSPLFSHVHLADGPVFAHEFQRVGVGAEHVVLSACDVGRAHVRHGEEALGLTASLLANGVRSVVASAAPVRDEQAEAVMTAYHRELASGTDAALALERAAVGIPDGRLFCAYGTDWAASPLTEPERRSSPTVAATSVG